MKRTGTCFAVAILSVALFGASARAAGSVTWTAGYPMKGTMGGVGTISGTFVLDPGYTYRSAAVAYWTAGGGAVQLVNLNNNNGTVTGAVTGLTPGTNYNFTIQVVEGMGPARITLASDTKQQTSP